MGFFNRFRLDVERVGLQLAPPLNGVLEALAPNEVFRVIIGAHSERRVRVELNEMLGTHAVACAIRPIPVGSLLVCDSASAFNRGSKVTERLRLQTAFDDQSLWELLPEDTRRAIEELLAPSASILQLLNSELVATLGPARLLAESEAAARVLASLDRLIAIAKAIEHHWDVDPRKVGAGFGSRPKLAPPPPPVRAPPAVVRCDPALVAASASGARATLLAAHAAAIIEPFPAIDPIRGKLAAITGKVVLLPPAPPSSWVNEVMAKFLMAGDEAGGRYFARTTEPGFARVLRAHERYERMVVIEGKAVIGLDVETLGALIGDRLFVDATQVVDGESPFAGEQ